MRSLSIAAIASAAIVFGCGSNATPKPLAPVRVPVTNVTDEQPQMPKSRDKGTSGFVSISDDVRTACGISDADAHFAFDSADVRPRDRRTLEKLQECFTSGKLKGHTMHLVGHADPRGADSYNLALGGRRADSVRELMVDQGMPATKVSTTSRGEMDARGTDESTWAMDRRVDVVTGS